MMKITKVTVRPFSIPLSKDPIVVVSGASSQTFASRNGAYLVLHGLSNDNVPHIGVGELVEPVFVLPGHNSSHVLSEAMKILNSMICGLKDDTLDMSIKTFPSSFDRLFSVICQGLPVSQALSLARFTVEQALLRLVARTNMCMLSQVLRIWLDWPIYDCTLTEEPVVNINAFYNLRTNQTVSDNSDEIIGYQGSVKIKVGGQSPEQDAAMVNAIVDRALKRGSAGCKQTMRIDANGTWSIEEVDQFLHNLKPSTLDAIEYLEEPISSHTLEHVVANVAKLNQLQAIKNACTKIALDESLLIDGVEDVLNTNPSIHLVYKPFVLGIDRRLTKFADRLTFTCSFETGVGTSFMLALAHAIDFGAPAYHGIHVWPSMADPLTQQLSDKYSVAAPNGRLIKLSDLAIFEDELQVAFS